jgi:hypothetical protein
LFSNARIAAAKKVGKYGICNSKQRYICKNTECSLTIFYMEYTYNISNVNKEDFKARSCGKIRVETDEMGITAIRPMTKE